MEKQKKMPIDSFIRWAGGKSWLIPTVKKLISNTNIHNYHEPFLGGASIFFSLEIPNIAYLSDINEDLINAYIQIRDNPNKVFEILSQYPNTEEDYYRIRSLDPVANEEKAARFIFLNQTSYNGLYRVNKNGGYNVPYGFRTNWHYDQNRIIQACLKLKNARINCGDFEINKTQIHPNDLVFLDPPYTVSHNNNGFIEYNKNLFSLEDQRRLSNFIDYIKQHRSYYILTNAAHDTIRDIFEKGDRVIELVRNSLIGGKNSKRQKVSELIFTNLPEDGNEF